MASPGTKLHLFNPENDLALAFGAANYTPPAAAMRLRQAGELLPLWWCEHGDSILCKGLSGEWAKRKIREFGIPVSFDYSAHSIPSPWGWSIASKQDFQRAGISDAQLPTADELETMRQLSHRRTAAAIARKLRERLPQLTLALPAEEARTEAQMLSLVKKHPQAFIKFPWSSSGRGIISTLLGSSKALQFGVESIHRQGSVMVERACDKAIDFAKIYECAQGRCMELGTSVFVTDSHGAYAGNLLATEAERLRQVGNYCDLGQLSLVSEMLRRLLEREIAPHYTGILGIDMLADKNGVINPVVEINLRQTMGFVANKFAENWLQPGKTGILKVERKASIGYAEAYSIENQRIADGKMLAVPANPHFTFAVEI